MAVKRPLALRLLRDNTLLLAPFNSSTRITRPSFENRGRDPFLDSSFLAISKIPEAHQLTFWTIPVVCRHNTAGGR